MGSLELIFVWVGLATGLFAVAGLLWSIALPQRRVWPPMAKRADWIVWPVTLAHFGAVVALAVLGWNDAAVSNGVRFGAGGAMLVLGHLLMMPSVRRFGYDKTSGEAAGLETRGLYRWSRNPQYVGDILILLGWVTLSAAPLAAGVAAFGVAAFLLAPFAEEAWLEEKYGAPYRAYREKVRRFV